MFTYKEKEVGMKKFLKKNYELNCGEVIRFEADSPSKVLDKLESMPRYDNSTGEDFLRSSAEMFSMYCGKPIRFDSAESFTEDLMALGILREVEDAK